MSTTIRIDGVKETLAELRRIDPELRKAFNKQVKEIAKPIVVAAQARYRAIESYPSGTVRSWQQGGRAKFPLTTAKAVRSITTEVSTSKKNAGTIEVIQKNPGAAIFEFATSGNLGTAFNSKNGRRPRVMWPAADSAQNAVAQEMARYVEEVSDQITRNLI